MTRPQVKARVLSPAFLKLLSVLEVNGGKVKKKQLGGRGFSVGKLETAVKAEEFGLVAIEGESVVLLDAGRAALTGERGK